MKNQQRIDEILKKILKSRKIEPAMVSAYADVIKALSGVVDREESDNQSFEKEIETPDSLFGVNFGLKDIKNIEIDGQTHPLRIMSINN